jgi:Co/Zn/Cd efflux system component
VENGRETKTHHTKDQLSNIIGSHTISERKYLFSQREKRQFTPSGSSPAMDNFEFLRKEIGTQNLVQSYIHVYIWRYSYQKNTTSVHSELEKPNNTLKIIVK